MLVALLKQAEKKLIAVVFVAHLPPLSHPPRHSEPFFLWPKGCHPGTCQQKLPEFDQLQSFTNIVTRVVKAVPSSPVSNVSVSRWDFPAKHSPILLHSVSSHQAVSWARFTACAWQKCALDTQGSAEKPRESTK